MSGDRLRLTTSRPAGYRRGGQVIGNAGSPTFLGRDDITTGQLLALLLDPNIVAAFERSDGSFETLTAEDREFRIGQLRESIELDGPDRTFGFSPAVYGGPLMTEEERAEIEARARAAVEANASAGAVQGSEPNTVEPQGGGSDPDAKASEAGGPDATADGSDASVGDAATPEPTAQPAPPAPEPAAEPKPASKGRGKAKGSPA